MIATEPDVTCLPVEEPTEKVTARETQTADAGENNIVVEKTGHVDLHQRTPCREPETQEMIAAFGPFDVSTIKIPNVNSVKTVTPSTATKGLRLRSKKQASFAANHPLADDSQKSIKMGFKVAKTGGPMASAKSKEEVELYEEKEVNEHGDQEDDGLESMTEMLGTKRSSGPKSILKSSNAISSAPCPTGETASTSMKQDAQVAPEQNIEQFDLLDGDTDFDLGVAMDDLGSYLGTWNAEQEASKLAAP
jgi:hypothetical protein